MRRGDWTIIRPDPMPDIPVERGRVGAMGLSDAAAPRFRFKPYVYRGTGEDQLPQPEPVSEPKPVAVDAETYRAREVARIKYAAKAAQQRSAAQLEWINQREERRRTKLRKKRTTISRHVTTVVRPEVGDEEPETIYGYSHRRVRPARGWRPLTGADIESFFEEREERDHEQRASAPGTGQASPTEEGRAQGF